MKKIQFWSMLKEVLHTVDGWSDEQFDNFFQKQRLTMRKFLPTPGNWKEYEIHDLVITLDIRKLQPESSEKEECLINE